MLIAEFYAEYNADCRVMPSFMPSKMQIAEFLRVKIRARKNNGIRRNPGFNIFDKFKFCLVSILNLLSSTLGICV